MNDVDCGQRLSEWRGGQKLTQRDLALRMGVSRSYIGDIEAGRSEPSRNFLTRLTERFGVSADWLLYGVGVPVAEPAVAGFEGRHEGKRIEPPDLDLPLGGDFRYGSENFILIRRMDLDVSAGQGLVAVEGGESEMLAFPRSWVLKHKVDPDLAVLVRVKGDSMAPTIPDGALILVDCVERDLRRPGIFAYSRDDQSFVKRLVPSKPDQRGMPTVVTIISDNAAYPPDGLVGEAINQLQIVGVVKCVIFALP